MAFTKSMLLKRLAMFDLNQMSLSHYKCTKKPNTYNIKRKNIFCHTHTEHHNV